MSIPARIPSSGWISPFAAAKKATAAKPVPGTQSTRKSLHHPMLIDRVHAARLAAKRVR